MFSISKLVTLAVIISAVWFGFRLIGRLDAARKAKVKESRSSDRQERSGREGTHGRDDVVDLVRDERTGEYVTPDRRDDRA
ncbi:MAG: hypothetical protein P1U88_22685 [Thalassobaculaceae bacterium]|nr:hypothetical protein [Thalassobaculaceae bacterium]